MKTGEKKILFQIIIDSSRTWWCCHRSDATCFSQLIRMINFASELKNCLSIDKGWSCYVLYHRDDDTSTIAVAIAVVVVVIVKSECFCFHRDLTAKRDSKAQTILASLFLQHCFVWRHTKCLGKHYFIVHKLQPLANSLTCIDNTYIFYNIYRWPFDLLWSSVFFLFLSFFFNF